MYSAYTLNKQCDNIQVWCTAFPILNQSIVPCLVLSVVSWPAYTFLRKQVRWYGIPISLRIFQFVLIYIVKSFSIVNKAEVDVFLELLIFRWSSGCWQFDLWSSAFSKPSLYICKFSVHMLLKPHLRIFEHYFASECNCAIDWTFFGITFLWNWNENWPFPVLWPLLSFPNLLAYWVQHFHSITASFRTWNSSPGILSPPLALFVVMLPKVHFTLHSRMSGSRWMITPSWLPGSSRSFCVVLPCILVTFS